jgi:5-methyltetrahydrofolate--homocysteine methyltransferase
VAINVQFDENRWQKVQDDWAKWWDGETNSPMVILQSMDTSFGMDSSEFTQEFLFDKTAAEVIKYYTDLTEQIRFYGNSWPKWFINFGPGIMAGFLGSLVAPSREHKTVWFEMKEPVPYDKLDFKYDPDNPWWRRILELTKLAVDTWGDQVHVSHTDLGGTLDILASFRTSNQLLLDLVDCPAEVIGCCRQINKLWMRYYDELHTIIKKAGRGTTCWAPILSAKRTYMLQCDFCYMISPRMFEKFVLDDLVELCNSLDHAFYHLDGPGEIRHLDTLLSIKSLKGIQWIPGAGRPGPAGWIPLLKRIRDGGKLCQIFVNARGAMQISREIGCKGFVFYIIPEEPFTEAEFNEYMEVLNDPDSFIKSLQEAGKR